MKKNYFVPENLQPGQKEHISPSGKYKLIIRKYSTKEGCWHYSQGTIFQDNQQIAEANRNYGSFPFCWIGGEVLDGTFCGEFSGSF